MNVDLTAELEQLLEYRDEVFAHWKKEFGKRIDQGWRAAEHGELVDGDEVFDRIDKELEAWSAGSGMSRFQLTRPAERDLEQIKDHLGRRLAPESRAES